MSIWRYEVFLEKNSLALPAKISKDGSSGYILPSEHVVWNPISFLYLWTNFLLNACTPVSGFTQEILVVSSEALYRCIQNDSLVLLCSVMHVYWTFLNSPKEVPWNWWLKWLIPIFWHSGNMWSALRPRIHGSWMICGLLALLFQEVWSKVISGFYSSERLWERISSRPYSKLLRALKSSERMASRHHSRPCLTSYVFLQSSSFYGASIIGLSAYSEFRMILHQYPSESKWWATRTAFEHVLIRMNLNSLKITELIFLTPQVWNCMTIFLRYMGSFWKYNTHIFHFSNSGKAKKTNKNNKIQRIYFPIFFEEWKIPLILMIVNCF